MRLLTGSGPTGIHQDELVVRLHRLNIAVLIPCLEARRTPVLEYERGTLALDFVMDTYALIVNVWHSCSPLW
jgi:hypothetical protein